MGCGSGMGLSWEFNGNRRRKNGLFGGSRVPRAGSAIRIFNKTDDTVIVEAVQNVFQRCKDSAVCPVNLKVIQIGKRGQYYVYKLKP